jgi:NhaP-type Na+/H+ or K+/H+ antiporter
VEEDSAPATEANAPPATPEQLAEAVLTFNEKVERLAEVAIVVLIGSLLAVVNPSIAALWFVPVLLLVIRPVSVWIGLLGADVSSTERRLMSWFGVRGIGSIYYLSYATSHGLDPVLAEPLAGLTLAVVATSIVVHGISVTPIMRWYGQRRQRSPWAGRRRNEQ